MHADKDKCPVLLNPNNGQVHSIGRLSPGSFAIYSCYGGLILDSSQFRKCGNDQVWSGNFPSCVKGIKLIVKNKFLTSLLDLRGMVESASNELFFGFVNLPIIDHLFIIITTNSELPTPFLIVGSQFSIAHSVSNSLQCGFSVPRSSIGKGFHIKAKENENIALHAWQNTGAPFNSLDSYLAININPISGVNKYEYHSIPYNVPSSLLLVGTSDDTIINIKDSQISLNRLETHQIDSIGAFEIITISSNKPLSIISSKICSLNDESCDYLTEQVLPVHLWGTRFLVGSFLGLKNGESLRIIASKPSSTLVTIACANNNTIRAVNFTAQQPWRDVTLDMEENNRDMFCALEATEPINVIQFARVNGQESYMMTIPAINQYGKSFTEFYVPYNRLPFKFINLYLAPEDFAPGIVAVDGVRAVDWTTVPCPSGGICGYISRPILMRSPFYHTVQHLDPRGRLGISSYGYDTRYNSSYGYPASMYIPSPRSES